MGGCRNGRRYDCIVVDLNTQWDFCHPQGADPVANACDLIQPMRRTIAWTKRNCVPVISSIDSHRVFEPPGNGRPVHCVDGSRGQKKIDYTMFPLCMLIEVDNTLSLPHDLFARCQQVIFRQRGEDLLANPKADRFLTQLPAREFIVFGNTTEGSVKALALGLVAREKAVTVVADACGYWSRSAADLALRQIQAKGGRVILADELLARKLEPRRRIRIAVAQPVPSNGRGKTVGKNGRKPGARTGENGRAR